MNRGGLLVATGVNVQVFRHEQGRWNAIHKPNKFTVKLMSVGTKYTLVFKENSTEDKATVLEIPVGITMTAQNHPSKPDFCEINSENNIYGLRFQSGNACSDFSIKLQNAIAQQTPNVKTTPSPQASQYIDDTDTLPPPVNKRNIPANQTPMTFAGHAAPPMEQPYSPYHPQGKGYPDPHGYPDRYERERYNDWSPVAPTKRYPEEYRNERRGKGMRHDDDYVERNDDYYERAPHHPRRPGFDEERSPRHVNPDKTAQVESVMEKNISETDRSFCLKELASAINSGNAENAEFHIKELIQCTRKLGEVELTYSTSDKPQQDQEKTCRLVVKVECQERSIPSTKILVDSKIQWNIEELKIHVEKRYLLPRQVQRWIFGRHLAKDKEVIRELLQADLRRAEVFMYVVKAKKGNLDESIYQEFIRSMLEKKEEQKDHQADLNTSHDGSMMRDLYAPSKKMAATDAKPAPTTFREEAPPTTRQEAPPSSKQEVSRPVIYGVDVPLVNPKEAERREEPGWTCPACTVVNLPHRPGCEVCSGPRPDDYKIPLWYEPTAEEKELFKKLDLDPELIRRNAEEEQQRREMERRMNYEAHRNLDFKDYIENTENFQCLICYEDVEIGEGVMLRECLHNFCKDCLKGQIMASEEAQIRCPFDDGHYQCQNVITEREMRALLTEEEFEKVEKRGLQQAEAAMVDAFHCKTPDCQGWCVYDDDVNFYDCNFCKKQNCLTCKAIHEGMNCKEYQDDLERKAANDEAAKATKEMLEKMIQQGEAMNCTQCGVIVQKKEGCDWIKCSVCKTELCWATKGPRWGPKGRGDISGGCKCGVKGQRCSPHCRNCH